MKVSTVEADLSAAAELRRGWYPVLQTMAFIIQCHKHPLPLPTTQHYQFNIQCVTKVFVQDIHKKTLPVQYTVCNKSICARHSQKTLPVQYKVYNKSICARHSQKISPQKWYLFNLKIKTSVVLCYRAGCYTSLQ